MTRSFKDTLKAVELNPEKEYLLICKEGLFNRQEMYNMTKETNIGLVFIVKDVNQIQLKELEDIEAFIKERKTKLNHA